MVTTQSLDSFYTLLSHSIYTNLKQNQRLQIQFNKFKIPLLIPSYNFNSTQLETQFLNTFIDFSYCIIFDCKVAQQKLHNLFSAPRIQNAIGIQILGSFVWKRGIHHSDCATTSLYSPFPDRFILVCKKNQRLQIQFNNFILPIQCVYNMVIS